MLPPIAWHTAIVDCTTLEAIMYKYILPRLFHRVGIALSVAMCLLLAAKGTAYAEGAEIGCLASYCPNQTYVNGVYTCVNFSQDYQANCTTAGITSWTLMVFPCSVAQCKGLSGHDMNIVLINNPNSVNTEYCAVEPQNGDTWCWYQSGGPPVVPSWIMPLLYQSVGLGACYNACVAAGDTQNIYRIDASAPAQ